MYSYDEYTGMIEYMKNAYFRYRDIYEDLYIKTNSDIKNKLQIRSRKSIHNIDACPRPNSASLVREFEFSDKGVWEDKKQNSFTCYLNKQGRVIMTTAGITQFVEINVSDGSDTLLLGFVQTEYGHELKSVGLVKHIKNAAACFGVMEIKKANAKGIEFTLVTEEYGYDENGNLLNILVYGYDSESEITVFDKSAPVKQLWYNELVSGEIYANPAVQVRKFIYENGALKRATSRDMYNNRSKTFIHKIIE